MASLWRYYQDTDNKSKWKYCLEEQAAHIADTEAFHMAPLCVDGLIEDDVESPSVRYYGDFVVDIDHNVEDGQGNQVRTRQEAIELSTRSAIAVVDHLKTMCDVNSFQIFASGGKGYHIVVPAVLIHGRRKTPHRRLPTYYKQMAMDLAVLHGASGIDDHVYAYRKGHLIRVPNKIRKNGKYKVQIRYDELLNMTLELYDDLCSAPRPLLALPALDTCVGLKAWYTKVEGEINEQEARIGSLEPGYITADMLDGFGTDDHPECVKKLVYFKEHKPDRNFNVLSMHLSAYMHTAGVSESERELLAGTMAEYVPSGKYRDAGARKRHILLEVYPFFKNRKFSCGGMRASVEMGNHCKDCPVQQRHEGDVSNLTGVIEDVDGYYLITGDDSRRKLTNFTLDIRELILPPNYGGRLTAEWEGATVAVMRGEEYLTMMDISREPLLSAKAFEEVFSSVRETIINVNDNDVRRLREYLTHKNKGRIGTRTVNRVGLQLMDIMQEDGTVKKEMYWIERGWSCGASGNSGAARLEQEINHVLTHQLSESTRFINPQMEKALYHLLRSQDDYVVATLLGWIGATQIKEHIIHRVKEFPLLLLVGERGSGKNAMSSLFGLLASSYYENNQPNAAVSSAAALKITVSESTTIPRMIDECSRAKMDYKRWETIRELLKTCYTQGGVEQGGLGGKRRGAGLNIVKRAVNATSPVIYLATSRPDESELIDRTIELTLNGRHTGKEYAPHFRLLDVEDLSLREGLVHMSKIVMMTALHLPIEEAYGMFQECVNEVAAKFPAASERTRKSFAYLFAGLRFFCRVCATNGGSAELVDRVKYLEAALWTWMEESWVSIYRRRSRTELDTFFEALCTMVARTDTNGMPHLRKSSHYIRRDFILYLNSEAVLCDYRRLAAQFHTYAEFTSVASWREALQFKEFYLGVEKLPDPARGNVMTSWDKFDLRPLEELGHDFSRFESY